MKVQGVRAEARRQKQIGAELHFLALIGIILHDMSRNAAYVIGLDGGGTKTTAQITDLRGTVLAETQNGPSNFQNIGIEESARNILDLIETCCHTVGCSVSEIGSVVAGLAGAGRAGDQRRICEGIQCVAQKRGLYLQDLSVESDARIALEGAFRGGPGIVLISGTGSIVFAKGSKGAIHRVGGWGRLIGDEGSGYHIGREGIRAVARMIDGRGKKTAIARLVASKFGLRTQEEIIRALYEESMDLSRVAPVVIEAAEHRDAIASNILAVGADELVEAVETILKAMRVKPSALQNKIPLVLFGGVLESVNVYSREVKRKIRKHHPSIAVTLPMERPVAGAALMALARINPGPEKGKKKETIRSVHRAHRT